MRLTINECIDRIKNPRNTAFLKAAKLQEERLIMHVEPIQSEAEAPEAVREWLRWVASMLPDNKYQRFKQLVRYPLKTVTDTKSVFDELSKIFDTPDKVLRFEFSSPEIEQDFWNDLQKRLNDENFWKEDGWEAIKTRINSFIVVDLPAVQTASRPEPYYYLLSVSAVHDVELNQKSRVVEYIFIRQADNSILAIDDNAYRVFIKPEGAQEWYLRENGEARHSWYADGPDGVYGPLIDGLGYAPVCSFWEHSISGSRRINKNGPLTDSLSDLDWLLFWSVSKKYLDLYGAWPIVVRYKEECRYKDENNNPCDGGYINYEKRDPERPGWFEMCQKPCPECAKSAMLGPGSNWSVEAPRTSAETDMLKDNAPVKFVEMSNDKLEYGVSELERLERKVQINAVGRLLHEATKEAINEDQVKSQYEAQQAKMTRIREQLEATRAFTLSTVARLRYGRYYLRGSVFMGKEYFLQSAQEISAQYKAAKDNGLPSYELARIREAYSNTKFKSDDLQRQRSAILAELYPYPDYTVGELRGYGINLTDPEGFLLKLNFDSLIKRFERENINIVEFGSLLPFDKKISIIQQKLTDYVRDIIEKAPSPQLEPGANGGTAA